jgi:hypothetical protein
MKEQKLFQACRRSNFQGGTQWMGTANFTPDINEIIQIPPISSMAKNMKSVVSIGLNIKTIL